MQQDSEKLVILLQLLQKVVVVHVDSILASHVLRWEAQNDPAMLLRACSVYWHALHFLGETLETLKYLPLQYVAMICNPI